MAELKVDYRIFADVRNQNTSKVAAKMKQNDTLTRYLDITVTDNGVPIDLTGCEVRIYGRKYDKTEFYNDGLIQDAPAGRCLFEATTQMLAYPGQNVNCEVVVFKDNVQILSTMPFDIFVVDSLFGENAIESSNEYGALVILFQNLYESYALMTAMVENIGEPADVAELYDLKTMWQAWEFLVGYMKGDFTDKVDEAIANASVQGVLDLIGKTADTGGSTTAGTVMAKLNAIIGHSVIKSIQHYSFSYGDTQFSKEVSINAVDIDKSFIIVSGDASNGNLSFKDSTTVSASRNSGGSSYTVNFSVVEFY